jgi:hypothetical protein
MKESKLRRMDETRLRRKKTSQQEKEAKELHLKEA